GGDVATLVRLGKEARRLALPPASLVLLAAALQSNDQREEARDLLRWARGRHPTDFWIAFDLGKCLREWASEPVALEERVGCFRVAVALRPDVSPAHHNLGIALEAKGQLDDAIAEYKTALDLDPRSAAVHTDLGHALEARNQPDDAIAAYRKA